MRFQIGYDYDHFSLHGCTICVKIIVCATLTSYENRKSDDYYEMG